MARREVFVGKLEEVTSFGWIAFGFINCPEVGIIKSPFVGRVRGGSQGLHVRSKRNRLDGKLGKVIIHAFL